jgi:hypothetical protein
LLERRERGRGDEDAVRAALGGPLHGRRRVSGLRVDDEVRAEALRVSKLAVVDVDRADLEPHDLGVLDWVRLFSSATIHSEFDHLTLCSRGLGGGRGSGTRAFS